MKAFADGQIPVDVIDSGVYCFEGRMWERFSAG
jgi:hypothetical protein